ncbi:uncharacterized protein LOC127847040 isoform X3 [Dreissena polymorpha]|uniref:uncharacterized protein LOC127847040 isoform X3 n=1 Tax=Dreissena polymorpha TaxID=45954 RepID=UPI002263FEE7|nr:uncharacterized protein LOC127847040 isoform X3 [Dreissena polymorpha]
MKWYLQRINEHGELPFKIGLEAFATCGSEQRSALYGIDLMARSLKASAEISDIIAGVVGPELSTEARVLSSILGSIAPERRLLQLGFSSSAVDLGDQTLYPNYARVIPSDSVQIEVMVQTMLSLGWNRIAVIYEDTSDGKESFHKLQARTNEVGICISFSKRIHVGNGIISTNLTDALDQSINDKIFGIVFFGTTNIANKLFDAMERSLYTNVPTVLLPEVINQDFSVFQKLNGNVIAKSEGSLTLSASHLEISEFKSHWKSVFTNATVFSKERTTNPWLIDVYASITGCANTQCNFVPLSDQAFLKAFSDPQPVYVQYAIIATHALAKLVGDLVKESCGDSGTLCNGITTLFMPGSMIDKVQHMQMNFQDDFKWSLESLRNKPPVTLHKAEVFLDSPFSVFNFKKTPNSFEFEKVGDVKNGSLTLNKTMLSPKVQSAVCSLGKRCDECFSIAELHEAVLFEEGEVYVVGVNPIFQEGKTGCGEIYSTNTYQIAESIKFAVSEAMQDDEPLSGMKIGVIILSSCNNPSVIQRKIYSLVHNGVVLHNGTRFNISNKIIGFVGGRASSISMAIAEVLSKLRFVQISYSSTSPALSDRVKYPYFLRTVTPDDFQALAMIQVIKTLKADYIQMVYSSDAYGEGGLAKIKEEASNNGVCLIQALPVTEASQAEIVRKLRLYPRAKLVIVFLGTNILEQFLVNLQFQGLKKGEFVFIGSEAWAKNQNIVNMKGEQIVFGAITMAIEIAQDSKLVDAIKIITPQPFYQNPWATLYLQNKLNCYFSSSFDKTQPRLCPNDRPLNVDNLALDLSTTSSYIATKALIQGATSHHKAECGASLKKLCQSFQDNPASLVSHIKATRFDIEKNGNIIKLFNSNGDGTLGYRIYNIQPEEDNKENLFYKEVGRFPLEGTFTLEVDKLVFPEGKVTSVCLDDRHCATCKPVSVVDTTTSLPKEINGGMIALGTLLGVAVLAVICLVVAIFCVRKAHIKDKDRIYLNPIETGQRRPGYTNAQYDDRQFEQGPHNGGPPQHRPEVIGKSHEETPPRSHAGSNEAETQSGTFHEIKPEEEQQMSAVSTRFTAF